MKKLGLILVSLILMFSSCAEISNIETSSPTKTDIVNTETITNDEEKVSEKIPEATAPEVNLNSIPDYSGKAYVAVNNNVPYFTEAEYSNTSFEKYSNLDSLGRCGVAFANIGIDIMPTDERGSIGSVKPSGWQTVKYDNVDGKYLYNRCHLIGFQLSGENANEKNLITGTRFMNVNGMLPFENMIADYVKETKNHVLYRVTPVFEGNNLLATGVLMEALSMEDNGEGICFNVFCYNEQPGISINHSNGDSKEEVKAEVKEETPVQTTTSYVANKNTKKFHYTDCSSAKKMKDSNKVYLECTRDEAISDGYSPCGNCKP